MKIKSHKAKMRQGKSALWDSSPEITCRKTNFPRSGRSPQKVSSESMCSTCKRFRETEMPLFFWQVGSGGEFGFHFGLWVLFVFFIFAIFCCLSGTHSGLQQRGKKALQKTQIQIGTEMETEEIHRLKAVTVRDSCLCVVFF